MNLIVFGRSRLAGRTVPCNVLPHPECPIEQTFHSDEPSIRRQLIQHAWQGSGAPEQVVFVAEYDGLRVLGQSEAALKRVAGRLRDRFGPQMSVASPMVRYACGVPVLEPYMNVRVNGPLPYLPHVRDDIAHRRGRVTRVRERGAFVLEAEAPLVSMLGYDDWLRELFDDDWDESRVGLRLSRYVPMDDPGPQAA